MQCKLRLLSALLCLGAIECQSNALYNKIDFSLEMPFDNLTAFYIDPDWLQLQMKEASFERFGLLRDRTRDITIDGMKQFVILNRYNLSDGGAICGRNVTLTNNTGITIFYGNRAENLGGAIFATENLRITHNSFPCLFINNLPLYAAQSAPSCIRARSIFIEDNPGLILFKNNHCKEKTNGGAIGFDNKLIIQNSGPVIFENNQAFWGGAICAPKKEANDRGLLYLFADHGNIIFNNNINVDRKRNSIHFQAYYDAQFGAKKGYSIRFYDPIEADHITNVPTIFNPHPDHLGTILFSGITVPKDTPFTSVSLTSFFGNQVKFAHGVVAVEEEASLFIHKLLPGDGTLRLGNSSIIGTRDEASASGSTPGSAAPSLSIPHLALNLPSLLKKEALPPKIWISPQVQSTTNGNVTTYTFTEDSRATTITISGDLTFLDDDNNPPYDSVDLSQPLTKLPLVYLCDTTTPKITYSNLNLDAINQVDHYGYQGSWEPFWEQYTSVTDPSSAGSANTVHRILYAHWTPTDYIPNPRNITYFPANSLWAAAYSILPYLQSIPAKSSVIQAQGKATRIIHTQLSKDGAPGFHLNSKGYQTSISSSASTVNHQVSLQFGQDFAQTKERGSSNRLASKGYTSAVQFLSSWHYDWIETSAKVAYAYGTHRMHNIYSDEDPAYSISDFYTQTLGAAFATRMPVQFPQLGSFIYPFVEFKGVHASLPVFKEKGPFKKVLRSFLMQNPLIDVSSALGVAFSPLTTPKYVDWFTSVAYQPTIYRQRPQLQTTLLASNGSWNVKGSAPEKHAILTQFNFSFTPLPFFHIEAEYNGSFASSTTSHFITAGCSLYF